MKVAYISGAESDIPAEYVKQLRDAGIVLDCKRCEGEEATAAFCADADFVWMRGRNMGLTGDVLKRLPKCRAIMRSGSGMDDVPCEAAKALGIQALNTPESIAECVAEHAVTLLFAAARRIVQYDRRVRDEHKWSLLPMDWHLTGRTLGLAGYGHIARLVERMVGGFNMEVIHYDPYQENSTPLEELLSRSDFVSLHCPLTPQTHHLMNAERFAMMKPKAILVNTSRGGVVDQSALVDALKKGIIGAAAIDVMDDEPVDRIMPADSPLLDAPNLIITPHVAAFSADFVKNFWSCSVKRILDFRDKEAL